MEEKDSSASVIELVIATQNVIMDNQRVMGSEIKSLWKKIMDTDQFLSKSVKVLAKQRRENQFTVFVSMTAMTYIAISTKIIIHQSKRIDELDREIVYIRRKLRHIDDAGEQEGK